MNDPCAPIYDPKRDVYHLFYQWHPQHINWGNISWGYATSKDMITWEDYVGYPFPDAMPAQYQLRSRKLTIILLERLGE